MKDNEYQCAKCGGVFEKVISDKVAWREYEPGVLEELRKTTKTLCDDCYQKMRGAKLGQSPYNPFLRWRTNSNEVYGKSSVDEFIQEINEQLRPDPATWLKLKYKKSWWWKLLHPKQARAVRIWLEHCREIIVKTLKDENFYERVQTAYVDCLVTGIGVYGRSPAMSAMEDIMRLREIDSTRRRWEEITEEITEGKK